jgi:hypothetical protein
MGQAEITAAEAQPVRPIQPAFNFHLRTPKTGTHFFAWHAPASSIPTDGMIFRHLARYPHA